MKKYLVSTLIVLSALLARIIPFNFIIGSSGSFFSWSCMAAPVIGQHGSLSWLLLFCIPLKSVSGYMILCNFIHRLPLFGSAWAYKRPNFASLVLLPLLCMILFAMHPVGSSALPYTLYWLIPMVLWHLKAHSYLLGRALAASFIAHGLGSVVWLYLGHISAQTWLSLIPIVIFERLCIALGIVVIESFLMMSQNVLRKYVGTYWFAEPL